MFKLIPDLLSPEEVRTLREIAAQSTFVDGRLSNPHSTVKNNLQLHQQNAAQLMAHALYRNEEFTNFAFPAMVAPPMLARYEPGMHYGAHTDAAVLPIGKDRLRCDLSCTIFLNDLDSYEGGALRIQLGTSELRFRERPGSAIVYPSTTLHEVEPVTRGQRLVGLTFVQSTVPDAWHRELLYELNEVAALEGLSMAQENFTRLQRIQRNLMHLWSDKP